MNALRRIGRALLFFLIVVSMTEVGVRLAGIAPPLGTNFLFTSDDPHAPWKPVPNSVIAGGYGPGEYSYVHRHNQWGFRDADHPLEKASGECRIFALGDSFIYGSGAPFEETLLVHLEQILNDMVSPGNADPSRSTAASDSMVSDRTVRIFKGGIPRYFPLAERMLLEGYLPLIAPDVVLIGFNPNDVGDSLGGIDAVRVHDSGILTTREGAFLGSAGLFLYRHVHTFRTVWNLTISQAIAFGWGIPYGKTYRTGDGFEKVWEEVEIEYDRMAALSREAGSQFAVLLLPAKESWNDETSYPTRRLAEWAASRGVPAIDLLPALQGHGSVEDFYWKVDSHPNARGYAVMAEAAAPRVLEMCRTALPVTR